MTDGKKQVYEFGSYRLDPTERRLLHEGKPVSLPPKAFETLVVLVEHGGSLVEKETLMQRVWADAFVEEGNLKLCVHTLRKTLEHSDFIETVPKKGYRFNAPVKLIEESTSEFLIERQTSTRITLEASRSDDADEAGDRAKTHDTATRALVSAQFRPRAFSQTKIYLAAILVLLLGGAFYFGWQRHRRTEAATNPLAGVKSVAVLPLRSLSNPPTDQELRVGMADSIITRLSALRQIAVRPTSATVRYLDQSYDTMAAGRELKVDAVLEGSVQKEGQNFKVNLQLVSVADAEVLWADSFTSDLMNVLGGEESVAGRVAHAAALSLGSTQTSGEVAGTQNQSAQELYLKGVYAVATSTRKIENIVQARDFFEQASRADPNFARAYSGLANTYTLAASLNLLSPREAYPNAERAARRALELDPNLPEAHMALGDVETDYNWNWQAGEAELKRAIELAPNMAYAHGEYGEFLARMGRFEEADREARTGVQLNPVWINSQAVQALHLFYAHRFDDSIAQSKMVIAKDPRAYLAYLYLSLAHSAKGEYDAAIEADQKAQAITGGAPPDVFVLGVADALEKNEARTDEALAKLETMSHEQYADPFYPAVIYALRGDRDRAFASLEKCRAEKSYWITALKVFPFLDGLRGDARFTQLLGEVNLDK